MGALKYSSSSVTDKAVITGLPIVRVPLATQFRRFLGLPTKDASHSGNSAPYGTVTHVSSRHRSRPDVEGDSVEELIYGNEGIKMTTTFSTHVSAKDRQEQDQQQQ